MKLSETLAQKKIWRAHMRRVKTLPRDYRVVYRQMQKYIFKIGPIGFDAGMDVLSGIIGWLEEGVAAGKDVLDVTGKNIAGFCDALMENIPTQLSGNQELAIRETAKALQKAAEKTQSAQQ